jgi:hypothetical protein
MEVWLMPTWLFILLGVFVVWVFLQSLCDVVKWCVRRSK